MKTFISLLLTLFFCITSIHGQIITFQKLIDYAQSPESIVDDLTEQGFTLDKTYGQPQTYLFLSNEKFEASSSQLLLKPNQVSYKQDQGETTLIFITVDPTQYESLSKELGSTVFAFELQNAEEHPFMDGTLSIYISKLFPNIELIITEVYVNENAGNRRTKRWKRYEIQLIAS